MFAHSGVVVKDRSPKLLRELALQDVFDEGGVEDLGSWRHGVAWQLGFRNPFLNQLIKDSEVGRSTDFRLSFLLCRWLVILEGSNLSLELVVEPPQCLLLMDGILVVKSRLLRITIWLACCFFICSFMSLGIWRSWFSCCRGCWTLAASPWGEEEPVSSVVCDWLLLSGGTVPNSSDGFVFGCCAVDSSLSWANRQCERGFLRKVFGFLGERSCV